MSNVSGIDEFVLGTKCAWAMGDRLIESSNAGWRWSAPFLTCNKSIPPPTSIHAEASASCIDCSMYAHT